jgi:hypothetical protein
MVTLTESEQHGNQECTEERGTVLHLAQVKERFKTCFRDIGAPKTGRVKSSLDLFEILEFGALSAWSYRRSLLAENHPLPRIFSARK